MSIVLNRTADLLPRFEWGYIRASDDAISGDNEGIKCAA